MGLPKLPKLPNCCYCCSLKTGTILIGGLSLVVDVILMLVGLAVFADPGTIVHELDKAAPGWRQGQDTQSAMAVLNITAGILLVAGIIATVIGACLVHGARTGKKRLMMPWIVLTTMGLVLDIGNVFKAVIAGNIGDIVSSILGWVLGAYLLLVVRSYKEELESATDVEGAVHYQRGEK